MKKAISIILAAAMFVCVLCACEATPDQVKADSEVTLDTVDWKIAVEGGSSDTYTLADAQKHELTKITTTIKVKNEGDANVKSAVKSFIMQGVSLKDFLADMGKDTTAKVHYYGKNTFGEDIDYELSDADMAAADKIVIGWIVNKKSTLDYSPAYVGLFFDGSSTSEGCLSLEKLVIS